jgi:arylsulfatase A-like enzyme
LPMTLKLNGYSTAQFGKNPDTKFPPIKPLRPPTDAPNVLIILIDDCGFGAASAFGGPIPTPNMEKLADNGLSFNRFHTTALCSPTRQALLTGRNHHSVNMGGICEVATSAPGSLRVIGRQTEMLLLRNRQNRTLDIVS